MLKVLCILIIKNFPNKYIAPIIKTQMSKVLECDYHGNATRESASYVKN